MELSGRTILAAHLWRALPRSKSWKSVITQILTLLLRHYETILIEQLLKHKEFMEHAEYDDNAYQQENVDSDVAARDYDQAIDNAEVIVVEDIIYEPRQLGTSLSPN